MSRPQIPESLKREVRQRCGFGCIICGVPLYEYHHMSGWASNKRHEAKEITLLCNQHHREHTNKLLSDAQVRTANRNPFNRRQGVSKPYNLHFQGSRCETLIGGNRFTIKNVRDGTRLIPLSIDGCPIVAFSFIDGHLLLHINLFDECNNLVLRIYNNELVYRPEPWDIQFQGRNLRVREAQRNLLVDIIFKVPDRIEIRRGRILHNGVEILIWPNRVLITNNAMLITECVGEDTPGGLVIGPHYHDEPPSMFRIEDLPRYQWDRSNTLKWAREMFEDGDD